MDINNCCAEIKATLEKLTDVKTPTARFVAVLMACGVTATSELAELVGVGERAVQKARKLLRQANHSSRTTVRSEPQFANHSSPPEPQFANHSSPPEPQFAESEPQFAPRACARAHMESPSGIYLSQEVARSAREREIEGLNGSTGYFVEMLAGWLAGPMSVPDFETSHRLLAGYVSAYSPDAVKSGMMELETEIAQGRRPRDVGKAFSGFVRKASERAKEPARAVAIPDWQQARAERNAIARRLREHLAAMEGQ